MLQKEARAGKSHLATGLGSLQTFPEHSGGLSVGFDDKGDRCGACLGNCDTELLEDLNAWDREARGTSTDSHPCPDLSLLTLGEEVQSFAPFWSPSPSTWLGRRAGCPD